MAAKDLDSVDIKPLEDLTSCCICTEVFTDPIVLPCIHTFCRKCLQETGLKVNKGPGDEMLCPICRRMFKIPQEGFQGISKNFFIERLIQVTNLSDQSESPILLCDACVEENEEAGKDVSTADTYCVDCNQKFCKECCRHHRKFKSTKHHRLIPMTEHESGQTLMIDLVPSVCELHGQKVLDVYCADCKTVVCAICFFDDHNDHKGSHVTKVVDGFRKQIESNAEAINECRSKAEMKKAELLKVKEDTQEKVENLESDVEQRKDELKQLTDKHATSLLQVLYSKRESKLKEIQMASDDIDAYILSLETYNPYYEKIIAKGSASDICGAFSDLSVRAVELQEQCQLMIESEIQSFNFCFQKSYLEKFLEENCGNLIGEIEEEGDLKLKKQIKQSQLPQQSNEIDRLRKEIKSEIAERESLRVAIVQLRINLNKEVQANKTLTEKLNGNGAQIKQLEQTLHNHKITCTTLQTENKKLKQELDVGIMTNSSLQSNNDKDKGYLDKDKNANKSLQAENMKLKQELDVKIMTHSSLQSNYDKLKEQSDKDKIASKSLQAQNYELKQELDARMTDSSLQSNNDQLEEELDKKKMKIANESLQGENNKLKQELDVKIMTNSSLQIDNDQLEEELDREKIAKKSLHDENNKLKQELDVKIMTNSSLESSNDILKEELDKEKTANKSLQAENEKLKQELDVKIMTNSSFQSNYDKLQENLDKDKIATKSLQAERDKLKQELDLKIMTNTSLQSYNEKFKQELDKKNIANKSLQAENEKLKQELEVKIMPNSSFESGNDELREELEKIANKSLQAENKILKQELDARIMINSSLQIDNDQLEEELDKKKIASKSLQSINDKLKQQLEKEKMTNSFVQEVNIVYKTTNRTLEDDVKKIKQEPEATKTEQSTDKSENVDLGIRQPNLEISYWNPREGFNQNVELPYKLDPVLIQTITTKAGEEKQKMISGLAILDKELFVVSEGFSEVEVHDLMKLTLNRRWNLKELSEPMDIGSCNINKCLYIFNDEGLHKPKQILRVDPNGCLIKNWSTGYDWGFGLSVTYESNVILTVYNKHKLIEYSPDGQLIREINLLWEAGIRHLWHAIKLTNGHFMVSLGMYDDDLHRVCMVDGDGKLVKLIGGECGMNRPSYLSIDGNGFVMVADRGNSRVLLFDSDLQFQREIVPKEKHGLRRPWRILLDEFNGRLLVADNEAHTKGILIFDFE